MPAEVETMAYAGEVPWHGLGKPVGDNLTPQQMLEAAELDWTVSKRTLLFAGTKSDTDFDDVTIGDRFALVRDSDESFLDIVGKNYQPTQNKDAFEFFDSFVREAKLKMNTAGSLCNGKFVWALAETANSFELGPQKDKVDSYILLVSPHQFGRSLMALQTTVRVVCQNTLNLALDGAKGSLTFRMPHTRQFNDATKKIAAQVLGLTNDNFALFKEQVEVLADKKISRNDAIDFFTDVLNLKEGEINQKDGLPKSRTLRQFMDAYDGGAPGANLEGSKDRLWGALNAVTFVMDHSSVRDEQKALRDNWFGYRGDLKRKALAKAIALAA